MYTLFITLVITYIVYHHVTTNDILAFEQEGYIFSYGLTIKKHMTSFMDQRGTYSVQNRSSHIQFYQDYYENMEDEDIPPHQGQHH